MRWLCLIAVLLSASPVFAQSAKSGSDWPSFLGPSGTSVSPEKGILSPWPKEGLKILWHKRMSGGYGPPAISRGKLYVFDRIEGNARLSCLKPDTGELLWKFEYPSDYRDKYGYNNGPRCGPIVDEDRVYLHGAEGMLHCVSADDGKPIWKVDTRSTFGIVQNFFGASSHPVVEGDLLIVMIGGSPPGSNAREFDQLKGNGTGVVAFDKRTGDIKYKITDELASYTSPVLATINGRRWCFVFARGGLIGFEPKSGKVDFQFPWRSDDFESVNASSPVVWDDHVFISECYGPGSALLKVRPGGYDVVWSDAKRFKKSMQAHWMTPIVHEGYLYGCSGRHTQNGELRCLELATGKVMWSQSRLGRTSLLMVHGHFVCQSEIGPLFLLKVNPKKLDVVSQWHVTEPGKDEPLLDYPCWAAPVLSHGLMYIRSEERLVCAELIPRKK
jgi:outer membrane protein assembly factor BamB